MVRNLAIQRHVYCFSNTPVQINQGLKIYSNYAPTANDCQQPITTCQPMKSNVLSQTYDLIQSEIVSHSLMH